MSRKVVSHRTNVSPQGLGFSSHPPHYIPVSGNQFGKQGGFCFQPATVSSIGERERSRSGSCPSTRPELLTPSHTRPTIISDLGRGYELPILSQISGINFPRPQSGRCNESRKTFNSPNSEPGLVDDRPHINFSRTRLIDNFIMLSSLPIHHLLRSQSSHA